MPKIKYYVRAVVAATSDHDTRYTAWVPCFTKKQVAWFGNALIEVSGAAEFFKEGVKEDTFKQIADKNCKYVSLTDSTRYCTIEAVRATCDGFVSPEYERVEK